jgi:hypothetical protein
MRVHRIKFGYYANENRLRDIVGTGIAKEEPKN